MVPLVWLPSGDEVQSDMNALYRIMLPYMKAAAASGSFEASRRPRHAVAQLTACDELSPIKKRSTTDPRCLSLGLCLEELKIAAGISLPKTPGIKPPKPSTKPDQVHHLAAKAPDNPLDNLKDVSHGAQAARPSLRAHGVRKEVRCEHTTRYCPSIHWRCPGRQRPGCCCSA